jgi:hypothetical protein
MDSSIWLCLHIQCGYTCACIHTRIRTFLQGVEEQVLTNAIYGAARSGFSSTVVSICVCVCVLYIYIYTYIYIYIYQCYIWSSKIRVFIHNSIYVYIFIYIYIYIYIYNIPNIYRIRTKFCIWNILCFQSFSSILRLFVDDVEVR